MVEDEKYKEDKDCSGEDPRGSIRGWHPAIEFKLKEQVRKLPGGNNRRIMSLLCSLNRRVGREVAWKVFLYVSYIATVECA